METRVGQLAHVKLVFENGMQFEGNALLGTVQVFTSEMEHDVGMISGPSEWSMDLQGVGELTVHEGLARVLSPLGWQSACRYCGMDLLDLNVDRCPRCHGPTGQWWEKLKAKVGSA